jgi:predicted enzyme related to lactoylglutathione lyase
MGRGFDHIDLRVRNLVEVHHFYENLLPALGFTEPVEVGAWIQFQRTGSGEATEFVGVIESPQHVPNECRTAFWAQSTDEVDRLARLIVELGARNVEGPDYSEGPGYYAVFFEDPSENRLEICHRVEGAG